MIRTLRYILAAARPRQWVKNLLLLGGLYFPDSRDGAANLLHADSVGRALIGFAIFCMLSSSVYLLNDIIDAPRDRLHPKKKSRPLASGALGRVPAAIATILFGVAGLGLSYVLSQAFFLCAVSYLGLMICYSFFLKDLFLIDVLIIAMGFLIRAVSGVIVLRYEGRYVELTPWFAVCVFFLCLLIAFCKRRTELTRLANDASQHRRVLEDYSHNLLDMGIGVCATSAILAYSLYSIDHPRQWSMLSTLPFVVFGIFRFIHQVYTTDEGDSPEKILLHDYTMLGCILMWGLTLLLVFYPGE